MTIQYKILILIFWFLKTGQLLGQTTYSVCNIHTIQSQNQDFFLKTIPFDNIEQTSTGQTIIFNKDSSKIYQIPIHFEISQNRKELYLSNDGLTIAYIINREFLWDGTLNKSIRIFRKGELIKEYGLIDLIECNSNNEDCFLFYKEAIDSIFWKSGKREVIYKENSTDFQKQLTKRATLINNDILYVFTKTSKLLEIDLNSTKFASQSIQESDSKLFNKVNSQEVKTEKFKPLLLHNLPKLSNGLSFEKELAKYLDMKVFPRDKKGSDKFKRYSSKIEIIVDRKGKAVLDKIKNYGIPEEKIKTFIRANEFATESIPPKVGKWRFDGGIMLMNKNNRQAKRERKQEIIKEREDYKKRIAKDSINGLYIPKNLEECFFELNKLLDPKDIEAIKKFKNRNETILYHHGFGTWLRNNWGLWLGSRLQQYLIEKGLKHPDNMSATILEFYYDWLNGKNDDWKKFENE